MDEQQPLGQPGRSRRPSGRDAKIAARTARSAAFVPFITRKIPYYEVLGKEGLELMEHNADTILEEIGIDFREDAESLKLWKDAGADVQGERVRFPRLEPRAHRSPAVLQHIRAAGNAPAHGCAESPDRRARSPAPVNSSARHPADVRAP